MLKQSHPGPTVAGGRREQAGDPIPGSSSARWSPTPSGEDCTESLSLTVDVCQESTEEQGLGPRSCQRVKPVSGNYIYIGTMDF